MRPTQPVLIALAASLLAGCAQFHDRASPQARAMEGEFGFAVPQDWQAGLPENDLPIAQAWAGAFGPQLEVLISEALSNNLDLRASQAQLDRAEALLDQSRAALFPFISASFSAREAEALESASSSSPGAGFDPAVLFNQAGIDQYSAGISVNWEADLAGVNRLRVEGAEAQVEAARAILKASRQNIAAVTAQAWFDTIAAERQLELARRTVAAREENLSLVEQLFEYGAIARRDVVLAEGNLITAQDNLLGAEAGLRQSRRALEVLLGRYPAGLVEVPDALPDPELTINGATPAEILRRRPDIIAAEYRVLAAFADGDRARASRWPTLSLSGGLQSSGISIDAIGDPVSTALTLGLQLADTLFDGGLSEAQIDAADASGREALASYGASVLEAFSQVETARDRITTLDARRDILQRGLQAQEEALELTQARYEAGGTDLLDVLTLRQQLFAAESALIANDAQRLQARIALYQALGGPVTQD